MDTIAIIAYALILYGVFTLYIAYVKPKAIWNLGKIQGFVQLLSEKGTVLFFYCCRHCDHRRWHLYFYE